MGVARLQPLLVAEEQHNVGRQVLLHARPINVVAGYAEVEDWQLGHSGHRRIIDTHVSRRGEIVRGDIFQIGDELIGNVAAVRNCSVE
jgi:hypothetical protein